MLKENVFVIGDTPLDVGAAQKAGYRSVAVASGAMSKDQLWEASPDFLLTDMTEGPKFLERIDAASEALS